MKTTMAFRPGSKLPGSNADARAVTCISRDSSLDRSVPPPGVLQSVFTALNQRNTSKAVNQFAEDFAFNDCALKLEFKDKGRLTEFFNKAREFFPDTKVQVVSVFECGDYATAEWKLTGTQPEQFGTMSYRFPVAVHGSTVAETRSGRIIRWSDYYDYVSSRRMRLGAFFEEWIEY